MSELSHIMVDLETLGTVPGCIGMSIGAVEFMADKRKLGREFYCVVSHSSSLDHLLREEADTKEWWERQSAEAKVILDEIHEPYALPLPDAMEKLNGFLRACGTANSIRLYGNGADFDNPILRVMYDAAKVKPYAAAWGGRCYRTLKNLDELFGPEFRARKLERQGTYHNALDDAKSQAQHLMQIVADIKGFINYGGGESTT